MRGLTYLADHALLWHWEGLPVSPPGIAQMLEASEVPSLGKEGWLRPVIKRREASLAGRRRGGSFNLRID